MTVQDVVGPTVFEAGVSARLTEGPGVTGVDEQNGTQAQRGFFQLSATCYFVTREIARRSDSGLPKLLDLFTKRVLLVVGGQRSGALGTFAPEKWAYNEQPFDEIHVNIGHGVYAGSSTRAVATDIVLTICHELAHLYAKANSIRDTSGRGNRYHNKRFAELARRLELRVEPSGRSHIGFQTTSFTERGAAMYADLISQAERELRLLPNFAPSAQTGPAAAVAPVTEVAVPKYVFAQCGCRNEQGRRRTFRMARGWWQGGTIGCAICQQVFTESPPEWTRTARAS